MSDIKDLIRDTNKTARKGRLINNILWVIVLCLVLTALYTTSMAIDSKAVAIKERDAKKELLVVSDSLRIKAENLVGDLKISEENLQGEKEKLEKIKMAYDSIRKLQLVKTDDLWEYALQENTIEAYSDYIRIKGVNDTVVSKLKTLFKNVGYVQIQESNGNVLIEPENKEFGLWKPNSTRSIRYGVIGNRKFRNTNRNGDVILEGQIFVILKDSIMSGKTRWAKIGY
jgi:hypothetical protein